jgi:SAM-dependent methyltransferase
MRLPRVRIIVDREPRRGRTERVGADAVAYDATLCKEEVAREYVFGMPGEGLRFLDVGARDGRLDYLLGVREELSYDEAFHDENLRRFRAKYEYFGLDLEPADAPNVLRADLCADDDPIFQEHRGSFDVVYSNNVFEHLRRPWVAARHVVDLLRPGGICITIAPFAIRYHAVPDDYFRYTHRGITALFVDQGDVEELVSGYDVRGRRVDWQGGGGNHDLVLTDHFGAWRENWFSVSVVRKIRDRRC